MLRGAGRRAGAGLSAAGRGGATLRRSIRTRRRRASTRAAGEALRSMGFYMFHGVVEPEPGSGRDGADGV